MTEVSESAHLAPSQPDVMSVEPFHIGATASLQERRPRTLKHGDTFAVFDHNGDVLSGAGSPEGIFHRDTRYLSQLRISLGGARLMLLSSTLREDNATLTCDLTNPDLYEGDQLRVAHDRVHMRRSKFLWNGGSYERLTIRNFDDRPQRLQLVFVFASDFADLFEVRGARRPRRGRLHPPEVSGDGVTLAYTGLDEQRRETRLRFFPAPTRLEPGRASFDLELDSQASVAVFVEILCQPGPAIASDAQRTFFASLRSARRALRSSTSRTATIRTTNLVFNEAARRAVSDLYMLITDLPQGPYPYAGIPWFSTVFGRDAIVTALQSMWTDPTIARGVLGYLAAHQAQHEDPAADAEPGKILHEVRHGEMAVLREVPFRCYYGSVDSTPLFVMLAGAYVERTGDVEFARRLWPNIEAALRWMDTFGDRDGDGFIEYDRQSSEGLSNQGWKDSGDSVFHADGTFARGPIALVEVQGYAFAARRAAASLAWLLGDVARAQTLERQAADLRRHFDAAFWDAELGTYVTALDGDKRPCRIRTSNAGHALYTGIADPSRAASVVHRLMSPTSFSGWGIRTVETTEVRYNPMSYHNGSVWPHDNAMIAEGFARYGFMRQAARVFEGLFDASLYVDLRRMPELFCGFARQRSRGPTFYPVACSPQAWATSATLSMVSTCLGLGFDPTSRSVTFNRPVLPQFLDDLVLRNLTVGGARVDVAMRRADTEVAVHVVRREGDVRVSTTS